MNNKLKIAFVMGMSLLLIQIAKATPDTLIYYMKDAGYPVFNKDSGDYYRFVMSPDTNVDKNLYIVQEFYKSGKPKKYATSINRDIFLRLEGSSISFFENGHRKEIANYSNGKLKGEVTKYYPNGKLYSVEKFDGEEEDHRYIECHDSLGNVLATDGHGKWVFFDIDQKKNNISGSIINGLENGEWSGSIGDTVKFSCLMKKNHVVSGTGYDKTGKAYPFTQMKVEPAFKRGLNDFYSYIQENMVIAARKKQNFLGGRVDITFVVNSDGKLCSLKVLNAPNKTLGEMVYNVVKSSPPWKPGKILGIPTQFRYTIPVSYYY